MCCFVRVTTPAIQCKLERTAKRTLTHARDTRTNALAAKRDNERLAATVDERWAARLREGDPILNNCFREEVGRLALSDSVCGDVHIALVCTCVFAGGRP